MSNQFDRTIVRALVALGFSGLALPAIAAPTDAQMARCAQIDAPAERLGCYDGLAGRTPAQSQPVAPVRPAPAVADTVPAAPSPSAASFPPAARASPAPAGGANSFGLVKPPPKATPEEPDSVKAHVDQVIESRYAGISVVLDNGQSWTILETEARIRPGDAVTVKRAALGSFMMTTSSHHSYRVRRLQ